MSNQVPWASSGVLILPTMLADALAEAAFATARNLAHAGKRALNPKPKEYQETLKPGMQTPLWNELAKALQLQISQRGEQARLARLLGLPRQRVHEIIRQQHHLPDAERTLLLLVWLSARQQGHDLY